MTLSKQSVPFICECDALKKAIIEGEFDNKFSDLQNIDKLGTKQAIDAAMKLLIHDVKQEVPNTVRYVLQQLIHSYIPKEAIRQAFEENKNWVLYDIRGSHHLSQMVFLLFFLSSF